MNHELGFAVSLELNNMKDETKMKQIMNWVLMLCLIAIPAGPAAIADFFPESELFVEPYLMTTGQAHPDLAFDFGNSLHVVWSGDPSMSIKKIFHRKIDSSGTISATEPVAISGSCGTVNCDLDYPALTIGNATCMAVFPGGATHPSIDSSEMNIGTGTWTFKNEADDGTYGPYSDVAVASYGNFVFAAHPYQNGLRFVRCNSGVWETGSAYDMQPGTNVVFSHVDIAVDEEGYIYAVFDTENTFDSTRSVGVCRSIDPYQVTLGFHTTRIVEFAHTENFHSYPAISITGSENTSDLAVTIGWIHLNAGNPQVYGQTEFNGTWYSIAVFSGLGNKACDWTGGVTADSIDIVRDANDVVRMVWLDYRTGIAEVYGAVSYNGGDSFLADECISCAFGMTGLVTEPAIAVSPGGTKNTAVVYSRMSDGHDHVYLSYSNTQFYDSCDGDFSKWDSASGVTVDPTFSHDPGGGSFKFTTTGKRGLLSNDFSPDQLTGTVDFWFFDSMSEVSDFRFKISGDNGTKSGVYRMVGINNASSHSAYSVNNGLGAWVPTSATRFVGWHHVIATVGGGSISIFIDPANNVDPVHSSTGFEYFQTIEFEGGTDTDPYYLDDVHLITEVTRTTPTISAIGLLILLIVFGGMLILNKKH